MSNVIESGQDIMDSRDVIARIDELQSQDERDEDEEAELKALEEFAEQLSGYGDWAHGETLIRQSYFQEYAQNLAEDIGAIQRGMAWPYTCIDWEQAANELAMDYTQAEFDGETYLMRA
jgi:hypothetical protein